MGACQTRIVFGMGDIDEAAAMARQVIEFDLTEPKPGFVSHQPIGHKVRWLASMATAFGSGQSVGQEWGEGTTRTETEGDAEHWMATEGIAVGRSYSTGTHHAQAISVNTGGTELEDGTVVVLNHSQGISEMAGDSSFETTSEVHSHSFSHGISQSRAHSLAKQENRSISRSSQTSKTYTIGAHQTLEPIIEEFPKRGRRGAESAGRALGREEGSWHRPGGGPRRAGAVREKIVCIGFTSKPLA